MTKKSSYGSQEVGFTLIFRVEKYWTDPLQASKPFHLFLPLQIRSNLCMFLFLQITLGSLNSKICHISLARSLPGSWTRTQRGRSWETIKIKSLSPKNNNVQNNEIHSYRQDQKTITLTNNFFGEATVKRYEVLNTLKDLIPNNLQSKL